MRFGQADRLQQTQRAFGEFLALRGMTGLGQSNLTVTDYMKAGGGGGGSDSGNEDDGGDGGGDGAPERRSRTGCPPCYSNGIFIIGTVSGLSLLAAAIFGR